MTTRWTTIRELVEEALERPPEERDAFVSHHCAHFQEGRTYSDSVIPIDARVVTLDSIPSFLLYRMGRKGWFLNGPNRNDVLNDAIAKGARYLAVRPSLAPMAMSYKGYLDMEVASTSWVKIYKLKTTK